MTEAEWQACEEPTLLLAHCRGELNQRKDRLLAVALCRGIESIILAQGSRFAIQVTEAFADRETSAESLSGAYNAAVLARDEWRPVKEIGGWENAQFHAADAVALCAEPNSSFPAMLTMQRALSAAAHHGTVASVVPLFARLARDLLANPFRPVSLDPAWATSTVLAIAQGMYESRDFGAMPILADSLEDAGCDSDDVLNHCRDANGTHVRGCWVVDLVLGKE